MSEFTDKVKQMEEDVMDAFSPPLEASEASSDQQTPDGKIQQFTDSATNNAEEEVTYAPDVETNRPSEPQENRHRRTKIEVLQSKLEKEKEEKSFYKIQQQELQRRLSDQAEQMEQLRQQSVSSEEHKGAYYESSLQARENSIKSELRTAKENGDIDREIEMEDALAEVKAEKSTYNLYKHQMVPQQQQQQRERQARAPAEQDYYPQHRQPSQGRSSLKEEAYTAFLEENPWADEQSDQFSPRLFQEANDFASRLSDGLRYDGNAQAIGTPLYFDSVKKFMDNRYGSNQSAPAQQEDYPEQKAPVSRSRAPTVAPVSGNAAEQYVSNNRSKASKMEALTDQEFRIARNIQRRRPDGSYISGNESAKLWAKYKKENPIGDGEDPYKIVID